MLRISKLAPFFPLLAMAYVDDAFGLQPESAPKAAVITAITGEAARQLLAMSPAERTLVGERQDGQVVVAVIATDPKEVDALTKSLIVTEIRGCERNGPNTCCSPDTHSLWINAGFAWIPLGERCEENLMQEAEVSQSLHKLSYESSPMTSVRFVEITPDLSDDIRKATGITYEYIDFPNKDGTPRLLINPSEARKLDIHGSHSPDAAIEMDTNSPRALLASHRVAGSNCIDEGFRVCAGSGDTRCNQDDGHWYVKRDNTRWCRRPSGCGC